MAKIAVSASTWPRIAWNTSAAECEARAARHGGAGAQAWIRQLCWRDFYAHVLLAHPDNARLEIAAQGGHCGFLLGASMDSFAEAWVAENLAGTV